MKGSKSTPPTIRSIEEVLTPEQLQKEATGNCYENAVAILDRLTKEGKKAFLVHGRPVLSGGKYKGFRYGHAWVEVEETHKLNGHEMTMRFCIDGNKEDSVMPDGLYYWAGQIDRDQCKRYTIEDVYHNLTLTGVYGPWEDSYASDETSGWFLSSCGSRERSNTVGVLH